jgi:hypothetical protein
VSGTTWVSARVKFWVTCSGAARIAIQVRHRVTCLGTAWVSNSGKIPSSGLCKESGTVSDKGLVKLPGKNSGKEAGQDKM